MPGGAMSSEVTWSDVSLKDTNVGDIVRVKLNAYRGVVGEIHNGRFCEVLAVGGGDVIVRSIDGILPELSETHHSPYSLEKRALA